jgi:PAS domain S-box-containing protein
MAIVKDVTDRRQVEIKLRESEARFRALTENSADRTVVLDAGGRATYVSPSSTRIFGYTPEEVTGLSAFGFMHPDDVNAGIDMFDKLLRQPGGTAQLRYRARHKDGRYVWVDCRGYNALDNAAVRGIVINERDITDEKELETQFLRAQRLESVGTLASGIAHDLNNILAPIIMSASMLRTRDLDEELKENLFSTIEVSAKRGADIVRQILTFTRGVEGERLLLQPLHILKEVVNIANETFPKNITVRARYSRGIWPVYGDPTQLHQVLMNLAVNARDAMPDGGTITLGAENVKVDAQYAATLKNGIEPGNYLAWAVTDTGAGIPAEIKDRIFDPFFTTKELGKGTGLGLSTVIGIVRGHNGGLTLESELGCGTKFTIFIPAIPGEALAEKESDRPELIQGNGELVLVVDDERGVLEMSRLVLERHGYRIAIARDGIEGLDFYARHVDEVAVVLTDIHMPKFDGLALVKAMRKLNPGVPIITSSGHTGVEVEEMLQKLEVNRFLKKPYTKGQLLGSISDVVEKANATRGATSARPAPIGAR